MTAIAFAFLAGRYHATPWGRHVNEGAVEWPPSPWRIMRALVATWKRTLPDLSQSEVQPILAALATEPPEFELPPASTGHTRHYMPWFKKGPDDRTLVFDTFVAVGREPGVDQATWRPAPLVARWPNVDLSGAQRQALGRVLRNLNTLGRSESWCEATLLGDADADVCRRDADSERHISRPLHGSPPPANTEIIRLLCPDAREAFADTHVVTVTERSVGRGRSKRTASERTTAYDPAWNLCMETLQLHKERWSDPPGACWVPYARPRDCFQRRSTARPRAASVGRPPVQIVRYALDSTVLPLVTDTLPVAEAARRAAMSRYGRITERGGIRGRSRCLSGKDGDGAPLRGHAHAYYLPVDEDGDGRIDHLTIVARGGFDAAELSAFDSLRELNTGSRAEARHPLRLLLLGVGPLDDCGAAPLGPSAEWVPATPFVATRHPKSRGAKRDPVSVLGPANRAAFIERVLREELARWLAQAGHAANVARVAPLTDSSGVFRLGHHRLRPIQFKRYRRKPGDDGGRRPAGAFRVVFTAPVAGPLCLGHSSHFGLGLFVPAAADPTGM